VRDEGQEGLPLDGRLGTSDRATKARGGTYGISCSFGSYYSGDASSAGNLPEADIPVPNDTPPTVENLRPAKGSTTRDRMPTI
jgi:hypothetical protein